MSRSRTAFLTHVVFSFAAVVIFACAACALTPVTCPSPVNPQAEPTEYFISLADPANHLAHVSIRLPQGDGVRTFDMPVWNALYQVRDFSANVENLRAQDASGAAVTVVNRTTTSGR